MHDATQTGTWDVRVEFETSEPSWPDQMEQLKLELRKLSPNAWAFLTDNGNTITTGCGIIATAPTPGTAVDTTIAIFKQAAQQIGITPTRLRSAELNPADIDPRS